jgi:ribonuclease HII
MSGIVGHTPIPTRLHEFALRCQGARLVAGIDEVGRGPLAGPVVVGAVVLPDDDPVWLPALRDSKQLSAARRKELAPLIRAGAACGIGAASATEIDALGIVPATRLAMRRALAQLPRLPDALLLDAFPLPDWPGLQDAVIRGDALCSGIAAASIIAKVARDRMMDSFARRHGGYGFERNRGYGTAEHLDALLRLGPCPLHRRSFAPVRRLCTAEQP